MSESTYDEVPYPSHPYRWSSPDRLGVVAQVFGTAFAPPDGARVLELGCAAGGNLLPLAAHDRSGRYHGVDLSARQIRWGQQRIDALGLTHATLGVADLATYEPEPEAWDYVICHGVFSWVPPEVGLAILRVIRAALAPDGVAVLSFNATPGWCVGRSVRDAMRALTEGSGRLDQRAAWASDALGVIAPATLGRTAWGQLLLGLHLSLGDLPHSYVAHEYLEAHNHPMWLSDVVKTAWDVGLRYLCDANLGQTLGSFFDPRRRDALGRLAKGLVQQQQVGDFFAGRTFHTAVLVRAEQHVERDLQRFCASGLHLVASPEVTDDELVGQLPGAGRAMRSLNEVYPASCPYDTVAGLVAHPSFAQWVLVAYCRGLVELRVRPSRASPRADVPVAWAYARHEAAQQPFVTNLFHDTVTLQSEALFVLTRLDGRPLADVQREWDDWMARRAGLVAPRPLGLDAIVDQLAWHALLVPS